MVTQALTSKSDSVQRHGYFLVTMALKIKMKKSLISKINTPLLLIWWAHQDLNLGPKDYEQLQEIKP
jgi:hypothetical protein